MPVVTPESEPSNLVARHHPGRPLDASRDDALRDAALSLLGEIGYDRLTMDAVASRACAGKATIYRRWSGKAELVLDALTCEKFSLPVPDTGTMRGDIQALTTRSTDGEHRMDVQVMIGLVSALPHDEELRKAFQDRMVGPHVTILTTIFERAAARGEIRVTKNIEMVASIVPAMVLHRLLIFGLVPDQSFIESVIDDVILPLLGARATPSPLHASLRQ